MVEVKPQKAKDVMRVLRAQGIIATWDDDGTAPEDVKVVVRLDGEAEARRLWRKSEEEEREARLTLDRAAARKREAVAVLRHQHHDSASDTARVLGGAR